VVSVIKDVASSQFDVIEWQAGVEQQKQDCLAEETPVALVYNGVSHAVMLATAQDLDDFALGFSLSEGIVDNVSELYGVEVQNHANGIELHCEIATERFVHLKERRRTLAGKTGCGLCGAESLAQAVRYPKPLQQEALFKSSNLCHGVRSIKARQVLQLRTGATHASAYATAEGEISIVREDVGRHNALDKLIGALAKKTTNDLSYHGAGFIITTSRASFEMVQKTASAGVAMLVAVSAPTGLAVRVAEACGLTLVGFARDNRYVVYSHNQRILNQ
jgi:FdhD protein